MPTLLERRGKKHVGTLYLLSPLGGDRRATRNLPECQTPNDAYGEVRRELRLSNRVGGREISALLRGLTLDGDGWKCDHLGARIGLARLRRGLLQTQAAEAAGITQTRWSEYETGAVEPSAGKLAAIALALEVSADELLGLRNE